jgi:hypothetical protein
MTDKNDSTFKRIMKNYLMVIKRHMRLLMVFYMIALGIFLSIFIFDITNPPTDILFRQSQDKDKVTISEVEISKQDIKDISIRLEKLEDNLSNLENIIIFNYNFSRDSSLNISQEDFIHLKDDVLRFNNSMNKIISNNITQNLHDDNYTSLDCRLKIIETAIVDSPERSLALYKLSNDMESLRNEYKSDLDDTRRNIDRVYSFAQWFVYAIIFLAIGIMGILGNSLRKKEV